MAWSTTAGSELPAKAAEEVVVRVRPGQARTVNEADVLAIVRASCPVHVTCRVEVLPGPPAHEGS